MKRALTHDEALDCIIGAAGVTTLSYQEAIESYLMIRRLSCLFTSQAGQSFNDPEVRDASADRSPKGQDAEERLDRNDESAVAKPDAQNKAKNPRLSRGGRTA